VVPGTAHVLPVGGISADNMGAWLDAGAAGFGIGGSLYKPRDKPKEVAAKAAALVAAWNKAKADNS
jgi:2-dehydro-3-deoxyphosphogalactonate aldolase